MPPFLIALWPLLLVGLQSLVSYLVGQRIFESLLLVGLRQFCKRWPNEVVIELTIAWADAVGKRALLGDLKLPDAPAVDLPAISNKPPSSEAGFAWESMVLALAVLVVVGLLCFRAGMEYGQPVAVAATYEAGKPLVGGGRQLESRPDPKAKPAQPVEPGAKVQRAGQIKFRPKPTTEQRVVAAGQQDAAQAKEGATDGLSIQCPDVTLDYTLIRLPNGQERMLTSSPDGTVLDGFDSPVAAVTFTPERKWAAGLSYGLGERSGGIGVAIERELAPFVVGADLFMQDGEPAARVKALWRLSSP